MILEVFGSFGLLIASDFDNAIFFSEFCVNFLGRDIVHCMEYGTINNNCLSK